MKFIVNSVYYTSILSDSKCCLLYFIASRKDPSSLLLFVHFKSMLRTIYSYIQAIHAAIILYLTFQLYQYPNHNLHLNLAIAEIILTSIDLLIIRRSLSITPLLISASLFSQFIVNSPIEIDWIPILFLGKIIYVNDILGDVKSLLFSGDNCSFCQLGGIIYNFIRFTVV